MYVSVVVEGLTDEIAAIRLLEEAGLDVGPVHVAGGKVRLDERIPGYVAASRHGPWLVLRDLDTDADCAPALLQALVPAHGPHLLFRIPVRQLESWLLADREAMARFLSVTLNRIPPNPDGLLDPKVAVIDAARRSRRAQLRRDMVPEPDSGMKVGRGYVGHMTDFIMSAWRPRVGARYSDSLRRALVAFDRLANSA